MCMKCRLFNKLTEGLTPQKKAAVALSLRLMEAINGEPLSAAQLSEYVGKLTAGLKDAAPAAGLDPAASGEDRTVFLEIVSIDEVMRELLGEEDAPKPEPVPEAETLAPPPVGRPATAEDYERGYVAFDADLGLWCFVRTKSEWFGSEEEAKAAFKDYRLKVTG